MTGSNLVTEANFARAETHRMMSSFVALAGGVNKAAHLLVPTPLDAQTVIRMNRDTLYSFAVIDLAGGATLTIPDAGDRYMSVMMVNEDHYINRIFHEPGDHQLSMDEFDTRYVAAAMRVLADPDDADDIAAANAIQRGMSVAAGSSEPFVVPEWDSESLDATRNALLERARHHSGFVGAFGRKADVDPELHLVATAAGWGGLPESEAYYSNVDHGLPVGAYRIVVRDVPVDAFWSISLYNRQGYFEKVDDGAVSVNSVTADREPDGSVVVHFGGPSDGRSNRIGIMDGWNYIVRLYQPHREVLDGSWTFPEPEAIG